MPELDPGHSGVRDGGAAGRPPNQNATAQFRRRSGTSWRMSFRRGTGGASAATVAEQQVAERRLQRRSGGDPQLLASDKAPVRHPLSLSDKRMAAWRRCAGSRSAPGLAEQPVLRDGSQGDHAQRRPTSAGPGAGRTDAVRHAGGQAGEVRQAEGRDSVAAEVGSEQRLELRVAVGLDRAPIRGEVVRW